MSNGIIRSYEDLLEENAKLKEQLLVEMTRTICPDCNGTGEIHLYDTGKHVVKQCPMCHGRGIR